MSDIAPSSVPPRTTDKNGSRRLVIAGVVVFGLVILALVRGQRSFRAGGRTAIGDQANESFSGGISPASSTASSSRSCLCC